MRALLLLLMVPWLLFASASGSTAGVKAPLVYTMKFTEERDLQEFKKSVEALNSATRESPFDLHEALAKIKSFDYKMALMWKALTSSKPAKYTFKDAYDIYFSAQSLPKQAVLEQKIKQFVIGYNPARPNYEGEVDDILWFYIAKNDQNLLNYLEESRISINELAGKIKSSESMEPLTSVIFPLRAEISDLLWENKIPQALPLIESLKDGALRQTFYARIFFKTKREQYREYAKKEVAKNDFSDYGLAYDYINYLRKTEHYKKALSLLLQSNINYGNSQIQKIWALMEELYRDYMDAKEYKFAYDTVASHRFNPVSQPLSYSRAEFLAGFVALRFLGEYKVAERHFTNLYELKNANVYVKSRGAYYLYRTYKEAGRRAEARRWLNEASRYVNAFYGGVAIAEANDLEHVKLLGHRGYSPQKVLEGEEKHLMTFKFYFDELFNKYYAEDLLEDKTTVNNLKSNLNFKIALMLLEINDIENANEFFTLATMELEEREIKLMFDLTRNYIGIKNIAKGSLVLNSLSNKASNRGVLITDGYGVIDYVVKNDEKIEYFRRSSLIHGIIKQESNFIIRALSGAGAIGLMQIMPGTGKHVTQGVGEKFSLERLRRDYRYNINIGSYYLFLLLNKFEHSYPLALAGYNAGPNRVFTWQKRYFEPKTLEEMLDFIELIPFKETREYVMRVMENESFYDYLLAFHVKELRGLDDEGTKPNLQVNVKDTELAKELSRIPPPSPAKKQSAKAKAATKNKR